MKSRNDHLWYAWIYILGSDKVAEQYRCEVRLQSLWENGQSLSLKSKPQSLDRSGNQIISSSSALMISDGLIKKMYKEMTDDQLKCVGTDDLKFLLCLLYKVEKIDNKPLMDIQEQELLEKEASDHE